jgi:triphosphoribosyl-dephospho-CoA synthase
VFSKRISINNLDEVLIFLNLASLLEISGWPKPGNVHRTHNFQDTRFEHFLAGISSIQPTFVEFCSKIYNNYDPDENNLEIVNIGNFYLSAAKKMMMYQAGGNVLLGHILILGPLSAAVCICLKKKDFSFANFKLVLRDLINKASVEDTILLYKAIKKCNPGGLGRISKYDLNNEESLNEIRKDKIKLKEIFELSKDYDLISSEYSTGFNITLTEALPYFFAIYEKERDINTSSVNTFLKILSDHPDTLIIRKAGKKRAIEVSIKAREIIIYGGISSSKGLRKTKELDKELQNEGGKLNPGTTADLLVGVVFLALVFGLRF